MARVALSVPVWDANYVIQLVNASAAVMDGLKLLRLSKRSFKNTCIRVTREAGQAATCWEPVNTAPDGWDANTLKADAALRSGNNAGALFQR